MTHIWMGRGDPFAYWWADKQLPGTALRHCTEEEKRELEQLTRSRDRLQELLCTIAARGVPACPVCGSDMEVEETEDGE